MIGGPRGLLEQETLKPKSVSATLARFGHYFRPYWLALLATAVLLLVNAWVQVISPELTGQAVDCYLTPGVANLATETVTDGAATPGTDSIRSLTASANCA